MSTITAPIAQLEREVFAKFPGARNGGIFNCRRCNTCEGNPKPWSQHAWGNAIDVFPATQAQGWLIYEWAVANKTRLSLSTICWHDRGGCNAAAHADHLHIAGSPKQRGTPPCSGGGETRTLGDIIFSGDTDDYDITGPLDTVSDVAGTITDVTDFLQVLADPVTWLRVLFFVSGLGLTAGAVVLFAKDLGVTVPLPPQARLITNALKG